MSKIPLYLAVDVGTGSVRVGLFTNDGTKIGYAMHDIKKREKRVNYYEQSTDDIWRAICFCTREVCKVISSYKSQSMYVAAIGIDATCSLVACSAKEGHEPISVVPNEDEPENDDIYNVMLWLDRRAIREASHINALNDEVVSQVRSHFGDIISPENEPPKLLWLLRNKPEVIKDSIFFDLSDWVAFKCHGDVSLRSACTVACKWGWGSNDDGEGEWSEAFWRKLGLDSLVENNFFKIGTRIVKPGQPLGKLTEEAAEALGLSSECIVASAMIDAHAGSLWSLGISSSAPEYDAPKAEQRLSVICGTSTCFIQLSKKPLFIRGVWGPFSDAVVPGSFVTEGGQSVTGELLKNTVERHPAYAKIVHQVGRDNVYEELARITERSMEETGIDPAQHVHCLDYHAGNRSPRANPNLKGVMIGLSLNDDEFDLAVKYRATIQAICYGARHIIEEMQRGGHEIRVIAICGGLCKSALFLQELADCVNIPVLQSSEPDTVLVGGAIIGKCAMKMMQNTDNDLVETLLQTAGEMTKMGKIILPKPSRREFHNRKYIVYQRLYEDLVDYNQIMEE